MTDRKTGTREEWPNGGSGAAVITHAVTFRDRSGVSGQFLMSASGQIRGPPTPAVGPRMTTILFRQRRYQQKCMPGLPG